MADLPILFSAPMVRAILRETERLGTGKTQTRRTFHHKKNIPSEGAWHQPFPDAVPNGWVYADRKRAFDTMRSRYCVGDSLYVREAWRAEAAYDDTPPRDIEYDACMVRYEADGAWSDRDAMTHAGKFRQGMHMPRWASRITLTVTDVRVERLQDITNEDCIAEGVPVHPNKNAPRTGPLQDNFARQNGLISHYGAEFQRLWDSINGDRPGRAWSDNPWIAAYTFRPILGNIDHIGSAAA